MISYFNILGESIERAWLSSSYDEEVFPRLVLETLKKAPPIEQVEVANIIDWILSPSQPFRQPDDPKVFGEPPVMLFQASRFYIEALFWLSGTTSIHEHAFSGAFVVLAGSSVHSHWRFTAERTINSRMLCGRLERVSTEILRPGDMRPIHSGDRLIHQLFHLEMPSVTIVIRTYKERRHLPQYRYISPGLAIDPEDYDGLRTRRLLFLDGMARGLIEGLPEYAKRLVGVSDLETLYYAFSVLTRREVDRDLLRALYEAARELHGEVVDLLREVCEEERRTRIVTALRSKIFDPNVRFLLALLMLIPDRDAILEVIRVQFPESDPLTLIETWLEGISGKETIGFDFTHTNRLIFRSLVEGLDAEDLLQRMRVEFCDDSIDANRDRLIERARKLANSDLFLPLLSNSPLRHELRRRYKSAKAIGVRRNNES